MSTSAFYPYRSEAARDLCFDYLDSRAAKEWPVASETRIISTAYGPTFVRISGTAGAAPMVLLPGAGTPSLMWAPNVRELSAAHQTFSVDVVGQFGRSLCTKPIDSFDDLVAWLDELLEGLRLHEEVDLVGISYGGALAAQYALSHPERLNKVVLIAPGNTILRSSAGLIFRLILSAIDSRRFIPGFIRWIFADMARKDPAWIEKTTVQLHMNMQEMQHRKIAIPRVLSDGEWARLSVPALFLVGENEVIYSPQKAARRLKRVAPQVRVQMIPGAGHDLTTVKPGMVNQAILEFLNKEVVTTKKSGAAAS